MPDAASTGAAWREMQSCCGTTDYRAQQGESQRGPALIWRAMFE